MKKCKTDRLTDNEIIFFYEHRKKQKKIGQEMLDYCNENKIDFIRFKNVIYTIERKLDKNKSFINMAKHIKRYESLPHKISLSSYAKTNKLNNAVLGAIHRSIKYKKLIEEYEKSKTNQSLSFVKLGEKQGQKIDSINDKQNDFEKLEEFEAYEEPTKPLQKSIEPIAQPKEISTYQQPEIIPSANTIKMAITKGIEVTADFDVPPEKILKIIQFLKGL